MEIEYEVKHFQYLEDGRLYLQPFVNDYFPQMSVKDPKFHDMCEFLQSYLFHTQIISVIKHKM